MTAVDRTFDRREAFARARPYSALVVGRGTSFLYRDGILCYLSRNMIRVWNVHDAARVENLIDLEAMGRWWWPQVKILSHVELLHCQAGILSFLYYSANPAGGPGRGERWLIVIDVRSDDPIVHLPILMHRSRIWVRNNDRYLYVGAHDGFGDHGHREWVLQGYDLHKGKPLAPPLSLRDFWGTDLRETIAFEIFNGYLYAVSNRSAFEMEEIDWTSFFWCQRFPVDEPLPDRVQHREVWRRQHVEGPINDSWTDLGLHRDERTGDPLIIEARKEWKDSDGAQKRTFYTERLDYSHGWPEDEMRWETASRSGSPADRARPIPDERFAKLLGKGDNPQHAPSRPRRPRQFYPEDTGPEPAPNTFLLSRTRYRTFLPASAAFLDVVLDEDPRRAPGSLDPPRTMPQQQIRLRIGSRVQSSPLDAETGRLRRPVRDDSDHPPRAGTDEEFVEEFVDRGIRLWPPANAPTELIELLNPGGARVGDLTAIEDERSLVYQAAPTIAAEGAERNIILINFDRGVRHPWLPLMRWAGMDAAPSADVPAVALPGRGSERREPNRVNASGSGSGLESGGLGSGLGSGPSTGTRETRTKAGLGLGAGRGAETEEASGGAERRRWWRQERAQHLDIQKGYRFE